MSTAIGEKIYKRYVKITKFLVEICDVVKGIDGVMSTQEYLQNFDLLLQTLLLCQSKSNGGICPEEMNFIADLTEDRDILKIVRDILEQEHQGSSESVNWQNIFACDEVTFAKIERIIQSLARGYTKTLVSYVALAECLDGKGYFGKLNNYITDLAYYYTELESKSDEKAVQQGILSYIGYAANFYVEVMGNMEEFFSDKNVKKELLVSVRKEYKESKRARRLDAADKHLKAIKERLAGLFKKDKENK